MIKNMILLIILVIFSNILSAYFHERDIVTNCKKYGDAKYSSWTFDIKCKEMKVGHKNIKGE